MAVDKAYFRLTEVDLLIGYPTKSKNKLGWALKFGLQMLLEDMINSDLNHFRKEKLLKEYGYAIRNHFE